jgi:hypothetical protein
MFVRELCQAGHTRRLSISPRGPEGWEVRDEQDDRVLKRVHYTDWHRVERALQMFTVLIEDLESRGWEAAVSR